MGAAARKKRIIWLVSQDCSTFRAFVTELKRSPSTTKNVLIDIDDRKGFCLVKKWISLKIKNNKLKKKTFRKYFLIKISLKVSKKSYSKLFKKN